jgi:TetR/AcrR family transcriptional regulator, cholesterol catabolism regulator
MKVAVALAKQDTKSERTRQRILDAAAASFQQNGYASVTLKDIAALAGLQAGSLYYHFDSKEEIVEAVLVAGVERAFGATREAVGALGVSADPLARLRTAIATHLRVVLMDSAYASANLRIFGQVPEAIRARHLKAHRAYGAFWDGLFRDAAEAGVIRSDCDLSVIRMLTLGALNWSVEWYREGRRSPGEIAAEASTMILDGIAIRPRSPHLRAARARRRSSRASRD